LSPSPGPHSTSGTTAAPFPDAGFLTISQETGQNPGGRR
jgi:hypothetical protein